MSESGSSIALSLQTVFFAFYMPCNVLLKARPAVLGKKDFW